MAIFCSERYKNLWVLRAAKGGRWLASVPNTYAGAWQTLLVEECWGIMNNAEILALIKACYDFV